MKVGQKARKLEKLGRVVEPALRTAMDASPSPEAIARLERLLKQLDADGKALNMKQLRDARAVHVLELAATPDAIKLLKELKAGSSEWWVGQEVQEDWSGWPGANRPSRRGFTLQCPLLCCHVRR
jgi:hypothetical protein